MPLGNALRALTLIPILILILALAGCGGDGSRQAEGNDWHAINPGGTGTALVSWTPPTQNTDGSALTDLAGYRVHYGLRTNALNHVIDVPNIGQTTQFIDNLAPGTWYFAVTAYTRSGLESRRSAIATKSIQ